MEKNPAVAQALDTAQFHWAEAEALREKLATVERELAEAQRQMAEMGTTLAAIHLCLADGEPSDFELSLPPVRAVHDLRAQLAEARVALEKVTAENANHLALAMSLGTQLASTRGVLGNLADDYEQLCGDGVTADNAPEPLKLARAVLAAPTSPPRD